MTGKQQVLLNLQWLEKKENPLLRHTALPFPVVFQHPVCAFWRSSFWGCSHGRCCVLCTWCPDLSFLLSQIAVLTALVQWWSNN